MRTHGKAPLWTLMGSGRTIGTTTLVLEESMAKKKPHPAGYSGTPLIQKLGIKAGFRAVLVAAPPHYAKLLGKLPAGVQLKTRAVGKFDFIHLFVLRRKDLVSRFPRLKDRLAPHGMLWISWPKGTSKIDTDLNGNLVRETGLENGLVDIKVCAVDEDWSGLKFVYRKKDR